jgi:hypothetical protein
METRSKLNKELKWVSKMTKKTAEAVWDGEISLKKASVIAQHCSIKVRGIITSIVLNADYQQEEE